MVTKTKQSLADLYLADETAWLDATAELIHAGQFADLDYPHLAEYLEDTATRDRREVRNRLKVLIMHVLKWTYQKEKRSPSWKTTVFNQQDNLDDIFESSVLRTHAEESLAAVYQKAIKYAVTETGLPAATFPAQCPWSLEQLLSAEVLGDQV